MTQVCTYYLVMELIGITLKNYIESKVQWVPLLTLKIAMQICMGIRAAAIKLFIGILASKYRYFKDGQIKAAEFKFTEHQMVTL